MIGKTTRGCEKEEYKEEDQEEGEEEEEGEEMKKRMDEVGKGAKKASFRISQAQSGANAKDFQNSIYETHWARQILEVKPEDFLKAVKIQLSKLFRKQVRWSWLLDSGWDENTNASTLLNLTGLEIRVRCKLSPDYQYVNRHFQIRKLES